jgi:hypothetical protein
LVRLEEEDVMIPIINLTTREGWQSFNQSCQDCGQVYLKAYDAVRLQFGEYLLFFTVSVIIQAATIILYKRQKVSLKRAMEILFVTVGLQLFWCFNMLGMYFLAV